MQHFYQYRLVNNPCGVDENGNWKNCLDIMLPNANDDYEYNLNLYCLLKDGALYDCITGQHLVSYGFLHDELKSYSKPATWLALIEIVPAMADEVLMQTNKINSMPTLKNCYTANIVKTLNEPMRLYKEKQNGRN